MNDFGHESFTGYADPYEVAYEQRRAPWWPFALGLVFLALSALLAVIGLSLENGALLFTSIIGYVLTPLATAFALIMAMRAHRTLSTVDGYIADSGTRLVKMCAIIALAGFVLAIPHIWRIADYFALLFAPGN
jgi:hypothetical protein